MSDARFVIPVYQRLISHNPIAKLTNTQVMRKWKSSIIRERLYVLLNFERNVAYAKWKKKFWDYIIVQFTFANSNIQDKKIWKKQTENSFQSAF